MALQSFTYYVHDSYQRSEAEDVLAEKGLSRSDADLVADEVNGIEVALDYEFDTVTKQLTFLGARPV